MNYIIIPKHETVYCGDNRGTNTFIQLHNYPLVRGGSCVKTYRTFGRALSEAKTLGHVCKVLNDLYIMTVDEDRVRSSDNFPDNFLLGGRDIVWNGTSKSILSLIDEQERGIQNDFPVTFKNVLREFVLSQKPMGINSWLKLIQQWGFTEFQHIIIDCANECNLVVVNQNSTF
jgi:hypothetical protein